MRPPAPKTPSLSARFLLPTGDSALVEASAVGQRLRRRRGHGKPFCATPDVFLRADNNRLGRALDQVRAELAAPTTTASATPRPRAPSAARPRPLDPCGPITPTAAAQLPPSTLAAPSAAHP